MHTPALWMTLAVWLCLSAAVIVSRQPAHPTAAAFRGVMLASAWWALMQGVQANVSDPTWRALAFQLSYLGKMGVPTFWLLFALAYTDVSASARLSRRWWWWAIFAVMAGLALLDPLNNWLWQGPNQPGWLFWPIMLYNYGLVSLGGLELLRAGLRLGSVYWQQALLLFLGGLIPALAHAAYLTGLTGPLDVAPVFIGVNGLLYVWFTAQWRLFDLTPIARDTLIENMRDAVLVLDPHQRVLDANPAARRLLGLKDKGAFVGQPAAQALSAHPALLTAVRAADVNRQETMLPGGPCLEITRTPVMLASGTLTGHLVVLRDITARHRAETALRASEDKAMRLLEQLAILRWIALNTGLNLNHVYETLYEECRGLMPINSFYIALFNPETEIITFPFFVDRDTHRATPPRHLRANPGLTGKIILNRATLYLPDTLNPPADLGVTIVRTSEEFSRSFLGVPLMLKERVVGVLSAQSYEPNAYTPEHIEFLEMLAVQAAIAVEHSWLYTQAQQEIEHRKQAETSLRAANEQLYAQLREIERLQAELRDQATRDPLTRLFNRRHLQSVLAERLARAQAAQQPVSVVILDVDCFKKINDTYGHAGGDAMLCALADLLRAQAPANAVLCRYGGEEFVAVLPNIPPAEAHRLACNWLAVFAGLQVAAPDGRPMQATFSAGVAGWPEHASTAEALLRAADDALYLAKNAGRNRVALAAEMARSD